MFVNVGRFRLRPMAADEREAMMRSFEEDVPPIVGESHGFRGVYFVRVSDEDLMTVWLWDSEADWEAAFPRFGPSLQANVAPHLAGPPDRAGGEVVFHVTP